MSSNCVWLQIIFCFLRSLSRENGSFPKIFIKKQTRWLNDNSYWIRLSQNILICHCLADQLFASADLLLATDKSHYFFLIIILVIFAGKVLKVEKVGRAFLSFNPCPSLAIHCNRLTEDILIKIPEYNILISKLDYFFGIQLIWSKVLAFKKVTNSVTLPGFNQILCRHSMPLPHNFVTTRRLERTSEEQKWERQIK